MKNTAISKYMSELGKKGAKNKWAKYSKEERSQMMSKIAKLPRKKLSPTKVDIT